MFLLFMVFQYFHAAAFFTLLPSLFLFTVFLSYPYTIFLSFPSLSFLLFPSLPSLSILLPLLFFYFIFTQVSFPSFFPSLPHPSPVTILRFCFSFPPQLLFPFINPTSPALPFPSVSLLSLSTPRVPLQGDLLLVRVLCSFSFLLISRHRAISLPADR